MKPYQGILAFIGYLLLQFIVSALISMEHYEIIAGLIALVAFGWLLHKKQMLHISSRDLKGSWPLVFIIGVLLAWIYWQTDNLAVTMVIHGTINLGTFLSLPLYTLLTTSQTIGVMACLFVVLLGIGITCLSTKRFLKRHDASN